jgi:hypothetical protein
MPMIAPRDKPPSSLPELDPEDVVSADVSLAIVDVAVLEDELELVVVVAPPRKTCAFLSLLLNFDPRSSSVGHEPSEQGLIAQHPMKGKSSVPVHAYQLTPDSPPRQSWARMSLYLSVSKVIGSRSSSPQIPLLVLHGSSLQQPMKPDASQT